MTSLRDSVRTEKSFAFDDLRAELSDLRHSLQAQRTEIQFLQERLEEQERVAEISARNSVFTEPLIARIVSLEKKNASFEKQHEKILNDLRLLSSHCELSGTHFHRLEQEVSLLSTQLDQCFSKLKDFQQLKSTLVQVSKAIGEKTGSMVKRYRVKAGDSLEKISREQNVSLPDIKRLNKLQDDNKILAGQELILGIDD